MQKGIKYTKGVSTNFKVLQLNTGSFHEAKHKRKKNKFCNGKFLFCNFLHKHCTKYTRNQLTNANVLLKLINIKK